jgi:hypothetical protein
MPHPKKLRELKKIENELYYTKADSMERIVDILMKTVAKQKSEEIKNMKST